MLDVSLATESLNQTWVRLSERRIVCGVLSIVRKNLRFAEAKQILLGKKAAGKSASLRNWPMSAVLSEKKNDQVIWIDTNLCGHITSDTSALKKGDEFSCKNAKPLSMSWRHRGVWWSYQMIPMIPIFSEAARPPATATGFKVNTLGKSNSHSWNALKCGTCLQSLLACIPTLSHKCWFQQCTSWNSWGCGAPCKWPKWIIHGGFLTTY